MSTLNPNTDKFTIEFGGSFYVKELTEKYNHFLLHKNGPIKDIQSHIHESIQSISIPGMALNTITATGMNNQSKFGVPPSPNTINRTWQGNAPLNEVIQGTTVSITFRNTLINWMYIYEIFRNFYGNNKAVKQFGINITLRDAAEIPMINFSFNDCFTSELPGLEFSYNNSFREAKTFDATFTFNKMDVALLIPSFNVKNIQL